MKNKDKRVLINWINKIKLIIYINKKIEKKYANFILILKILILIILYKN
jgi:hypothetical protein